MNDIAKYIYLCGGYKNAKVVDKESEEYIRAMEIAISYAKRFERHGILSKPNADYQDIESMVMNRKYTIEREDTKHIKPYDYYLVVMCRDFEYAVFIAFNLVTDTYDVYGVSIRIGDVEFIERIK